MRYGAEVQFKLAVPLNIYTNNLIFLSNHVHIRTIPVFRNKASVISDYESCALSENSACYEVILYLEAVVLCSVIEHGMTSFTFQTTRKSENSVKSYYAL